MADYNIENLKGAQVRHSIYGEGTIEDIKNNYLYIKFGDMEMKRFQYPDAFEKFLEIVNADLNEVIEKDLEIRKSEESYIVRKRSETMYDNVKKFGEKKAAEHQRKLQIQIEKQRRTQMMRDQRVRYGDSKSENTSK